MHCAELTQLGFWSWWVRSALRMHRAGRAFSGSKLKRCGIEAASPGTFDYRSTQLVIALEKTPEAGLVENQQCCMADRRRLGPSGLAAQQRKLSEHLAAAQPELLSSCFELDCA